MKGYTIYDARGKILGQCNELALACYEACKHVQPNKGCVYVLCPGGMEIVFVPPITWGARAPAAIETLSSRGLIGKDSEQS